MSTPVRSLSRLALCMLGVGLLGALGIGWAFGFHQGASFALGAALMLANMAGLAWAWWRVITQKTIAWTVLIIVIKYAVLLSAIFYMAKAEWFSVTLAGLGIASFLVAVLIWATTLEK